MGRLYSFICCSQNGRSYRLNLSSYLLVTVISLLVISVIGLFVSIGYNVYFYQVYSKSKDFVVEQEYQSQTVQALKAEIHSLRHITEDLVKKEEMLRQDLGRPRYRSLVKKKRIRNKIRAFSKGFPDEMQSNYAIFQISNELDYLKTNILQMERRMRNHLFVFSQYQDWFDQMPSIWPVYGHIQSKYGWRMHPLTRKRQFHKGIDIPAWIGAPVQATADGYVEFSGWDGGYGWMVVIAHSFSYRTIYAHMSEIDIVQGVRVSKGQIIGKIGTSGRSTGPHIHYEIRQGRKALDPLQYLDLDLFTAVSKLW